MEKQGRSGILFRCFKEHTKIGLDICAGTCYNIVRKCGHRTSASISAFQAEEVGSIPIARSMQTKIPHCVLIGTVWDFLFSAVRYPISTFAALFSLYLRSQIVTYTPLPHLLQTHKIKHSEVNSNV